MNTHTIIEDNVIYILENKSLRYNTCLFVQVKRLKSLTEAIQSKDSDVVSEVKAKSTRRGRTPTEDRDKPTFTRVKVIGSEEPDEVKRALDKVVNADWFAIFINRVHICTIRTILLDAILLYGISNRIMCFITIHVYVCATLCNHIYPYNNL